MKILIVPHYRNPEAVESGLLLETWLKRQGFDVVWAPDRSSDKVSPVDIEDVELVISLGGDGTLLRAARIVNYREIPILGLSYGHLGFLTAASPEEASVLGVVQDALAGEMHVSRRATIEGDIRWMDKEGAEAHTRVFALNDIAVTRGLNDILEFDVQVSGYQIDRLRADGFVVSTATGSTGYALSAGGPIVNPDFKGLVCVPVAPHTIQARAFLTSSSDVVEIEMSRERFREATVTADGQTVGAPGAMTHATIKRGPGDVLLLDYGPESFYNSVSRVFYGVRHDR